MSSSEMQSVLAELQEVLAERGVASLGFRPPASDSAIREFEAAIGVALPEDYRQFLAIADGQQDPPPIALFPGGHFVPLSDLLQCWKDEKDESDEGYEEEEECSEHDAIRYLRYHPLRIPIDGTRWLDGDNAYLDLTPGPAGRVGQVIGLVTESSFVVLGHSFTDYLQRLVGLLRAGTIEVVNEDPGPHLAKANKQAPWEGWSGLLMAYGAER